jgi:hypothetical protein
MDTANEARGVVLVFGMFGGWHRPAGQREHPLGRDTNLSHRLNGVNSWALPTSA